MCRKDVSALGHVDLASTFSLSVTICGRSSSHLATYHVGSLDPNFEGNRTMLSIYYREEPLLSMTCNPSHQFCQATLVVPFMFIIAAEGDEISTMFME